MHKLDYISLNTTRNIGNWIKMNGNTSKLLIVIVVTLCIALGIFYKKMQSLETTVVELRDRPRLSKVADALQALKPGALTHIHSVPEEKPTERETTNPAKETEAKTSFCNVHNFSTVINTSDAFQFECIGTRTKPPTKICLYPNKVDVWVSQGIRKGGVWEGNINQAIINALTKYPNAQLIDIGANLGMHSLVAAEFGRKVVAVEPQAETVKRLHKSVNLNHYQDRYTLVKNGISNVRANFTLTAPTTNQGGTALLQKVEPGKQVVQTILMDDLLEVIDFKEAVIKMDIETSESRALVHSDKLFSAVKVYAIFMEWAGMKAIVKANTRTDDIVIIKDMIKHLRDLGFKPQGISPTFSHTDANFLPDSSMLTWPGDIVWLR